MKIKWGQGNFLPAPQKEGEPTSEPAFEVPRYEERPVEKPSAPEAKKPEWVSPYKNVVGPADTSLNGIPISADRAQRWKDRMMLAYDRINKELTELSFFKEIYELMGSKNQKGYYPGGQSRFMPMEPMLKTFNDLINSYVTNIADANLKDAFMFGVKYVAAFNDLRTMLSRMVKNQDNKLKLDHAIWSTQKFMWKRIKDLLNIHDIGSQDLGMSPEEATAARKILGQLPRGTWTYGPMQDPTAPLLKARTWTHQNKQRGTMTRLLKEIEQEKGNKK